MRRFISSEFQTDRGRPIYFNEYDEPCYAPLPNNYASAVEAGPIMYRQVISDPKKVESVIPSVSFTQKIPKKDYFEDCEIDIIISLKKKTKQKNKKKEKELRKKLKTKHNKESFWFKQKVYTECLNENDITTNLYCDCYYCTNCETYNENCLCDSCECKRWYREYERYEKYDYY